MSIQSQILKVVYSNGEHHVINDDEVLFAEGCGGNYCKIVLIEKNIIVSKTLSECCKFFNLTRVHKSFGANISKVKKVNLKDNELFFDSKKSCFYSRNFNLNINCL